MNKETDSEHKRIIKEKYCDQFHYATNFLDLVDKIATNRLVVLPVEELNRLLSERAQLIAWYYQVFFYSDALLY